MTKTVTFISGNEYCLQELFGNDTKIIIPDLQRDYCWGDNAYTSSIDKKPRELVSYFVRNIMELYEEDRKKMVTLGLIYGYEQPHNHIQICDGQQRLTTLFLLLGFVNIKSQGKFDEHIISQNEMQDDYEPHLQYAIRESTLYFLSDLAKNVFIDRSTDIMHITEADWYFNEYDQDASIQSMIAALNTINGFFSAYQEFDYVSFGEFLLKNLRVLYYNMENRSRGEETYVVINTTGEPLSATENIKPILLGNASFSDDERETYSCQWEEREDWFWQNRGNDKIADEGMYEFFMWYWQIGLLQENRWRDGQKLPLDIRELFISVPKKIAESANDEKPNISNYKKFRTLDNLNKYFNALKSLVSEILTTPALQNTLSSTRKKNDISFDSQANVWKWLRTSDLDIVLPLIAFMAEKGNTSLLSRFVKRLRKNHFDGIWSKNGNEPSRRGKNYMDWRYIIQIINQTTESGLLKADPAALNLSKIPMTNIPVWYNEDERQKEILALQSISIEEMEDNEFLMGDLTPLWFVQSSPNMVRKRWETLKRMCDAFDMNKAKDDIAFSNWFRLYRLASGLVEYGHIDYCYWTFEGIYYSKKPNSPWWIENHAIEKLMEQDNPLTYMKDTVRQKVKSFIYGPSTHQELILGWMTIKTILADKGNYLINYWNERALSAYIEMKDNYIFQTDEFHWGNVMCGYSYKYAVLPARDESNWNRPENLDSPLLPRLFICNYYDRNKIIDDWKEIYEIDIQIKNILDDFLAGTDSHE